MQGLQTFMFWVVTTAAYLTRLDTRSIEGTRSQGRALQAPHLVKVHIDRLSTSHVCLMANIQPA